MIPGFFLAENKCNETEKILICTKGVEEYLFDKIDNLHAQLKQYIYVHAWRIHQRRSSRPGESDLVRPIQGKQRI